MRPKTPIVLDIPTPCSESPESMQTRPDGWFCPSCSKTVVDFSAMTDREVAAYVRTKGPGCGLFRAGQLRRPILELQQKPRWQRWAAAVSLLLSLPDEGRAQGLPVAAADTILRPKPPAPPRPGSCSIRLQPLENPFKKREPSLRELMVENRSRVDLTVMGFYVSTDLPPQIVELPRHLRLSDQQRLLGDYKLRVPELPALPLSPHFPLQRSPFWRRQ